MHRQWLHSLSKYPGPWFNSVSSIPSAIAAFRGVQHLYNYKLHQRYGPVVRISPDELSFTESYAWEQIYGNRVCSFRTIYELVVMSADHSV